jgi:hypothetical protein
MKRLVRFIFLVIRLRSISRAIWIDQYENAK